MRVEAIAKPKPSTMVSPQDTLHLVAAPERFVSRAGRKLEAALDTFNIDVSSLRCLDAGASTGGFTDCLLQRGASHVVALDVGHGQLNWKIRNDPNVHVIERTNLRTADPVAVGGPFDMVVADLSFISLRTVAASLLAMGTDGTNWVFLIKPQFEAGRDRVGKGGIVRDSAVRYDVLDTVLRHLADTGLNCVGLMTSPVTGATGNIEFLGWFTRGEGGVAEAHLRRLIEGIQE